MALIAGQFVMVLIMTMTPLHMTDHGHGLTAVGTVISAHVFGMYALAPISGRLTDRFGPLPIIYAGLAVLVAAAVLSALAPPMEELLLLVALFLLGWGWNLGFVAGSSLLTGAVTIAERPRIQGVSDALIWSTSAIASVGSGVIVGWAGFAWLGMLGAMLVAVVGAVLLWGRGAFSAAAGGDDRVTIAG
jgi:MFS family permease